VGKPSKESKAPAARIPVFWTVLFHTGSCSMHPKKV
jgi:hypothetical protein